MQGIGGHQSWMPNPIKWIHLIQRDDGMLPKLVGTQNVSRLRGNQPIYKVLYQSFILQSIKEIQDRSYLLQHRTDQRSETLRKIQPPHQTKHEHLYCQTQ